MQTATLTEIRKELATYPADELAKVCLRMARFAKGNKELLTYLLFDSNHEEGYIEDMQNWVEEGFEEIDFRTRYFAMKKLRKILSALKKKIRYSGNKITEIRLLLFFCEKVIENDWPIIDSTSLNKMLHQQTKRASTILNGLHEDLKMDFQRRIEDIVMSL